MSRAKYRRLLDENPVVVNDHLISKRLDRLKLLADERKEKRPKKEKPTFQFIRGVPKEERQKISRKVLLGILSDYGIGEEEYIKHEAWMAQIRKDYKDGAERGRGRPNATKWRQKIYEHRGGVRPEIKRQVYKRKTKDTSS